MCDEENIFVTGTFHHCHPFEMHEDDAENVAQVTKEIENE